MALRRAITTTGGITIELAADCRVMHADYLCDLSSRMFFLQQCVYLISLLTGELCIVFDWCHSFRQERVVAMLLQLAFPRSLHTTLSKRDGI